MYGSILYLEVYLNILCIYTLYWAVIDTPRNYSSLLDPVPKAEIKCFLILYQQKK